MINIELKIGEMTQACQVGIFRKLRAIKHDCKITNGARSSWSDEIQGAIGELVTAKYLQTYWSGAAQHFRSDVGELEVRTSANPKARLILHPTDPSPAIFVLVTATDRPLIYSIVGWIRCGDGKRDKYWQDPTGKNRPAYFVPRNQLRSPVELLNKSVQQVLT